MKVYESFRKLQEITKSIFTKYTKRFKGITEDDFDDIVQTVHMFFLEEDIDDEIIAECSDEICSKIEEIIARYISNISYNTFTIEDIQQELDNDSDTIHNIRERIVSLSL